MSTLSKDEFAGHVAAAYDRLYDVVALRTSPLIPLLLSKDTSQTSTELAWDLHHKLIDAVEELDPTSDAPPFSRAWRRHRLMVLHYLEGLNPQAVADRLNISRRTYYREHKLAIEAIADLLWDKRGGALSTSEEDDATQHVPDDLDRMELLRLHAARASQSERYAPATKVIDGAISLAQKLADEKGVEVRVSGDTPRRAAMVEKNATRQVILATLDLVLGPMQGGRLEIHYTFKPDSLEVVCVARCEDVNADRLQHREADPKVLGELAQSQQIALHPIERNGRVEGFCLQVPTKRLTTILVVDDNDDMLGLFERYLRSHDYGVIKARRGREAISLARSHQPDVILLDLMIPDQDGWEVLQTLSNQPGTERIPIMVCTVLSAKRLALALGAAVFLEKPITEDKLISALASVDEKSSGGSIQ